MIRPLCLLLFAGSLLAQDLPGNFFGCGVGYSSSARPNLTGWCSYGHLLSQSGQLYYFATTEYAPIRTANGISIQNTLDPVGAALVLRKWGPVSVLAIGAAGGTFDNKDVARSLLAGGMVTWNIGKTDFLVVFDFRATSDNLPSSQQSWQSWKLGLGRVW